MQFMELPGRREPEQVAEQVVEQVAEQVALFGRLEGNANKGA